MCIIKPHLLDTWRCFFERPFGYVVGRLTRRFVVLPVMLLIRSVPFSFYRFLAVWVIQRFASRPFGDVDHTANYFASVFLAARSPYLTRWVVQSRTPPLLFFNSCVVVCVPVLLLSTSYSKLRSIKLSIFRDFSPTLLTTCRLHLFPFSQVSHHTPYSPE